MFLGVFDIGHSFYIRLAIERLRIFVKGDPPNLNDDILYAIIDGIAIIIKSQTILWSTNRIRWFNYVSFKIQETRTPTE